MFDKFREECGVFGIYGHGEASKLAYLGLYALQHRGPESAGIATADGVLIRTVREMGYVSEILMRRRWRRCRVISLSVTPVIPRLVRASSPMLSPSSSTASTGSRRVPQRQYRQCQ